MHDPPGSASDRAELSEIAPSAGASYRWLWLLSVLLIVGGLLTLGGALGTGLSLGPDGAPTAPDAQRLRALLVAGAAALIAGLLLNAARSIAVRRRLPEERYRGPSILVMLLLAAILAAGLSLLAADDLLALQENEAPSVPGALLILTVNQVAMVVVAAIFVFWPQALAGARFLGSRGALDGVGSALLLAVPAWLATQLLSVLVNILLQGLGMEFEPGLAEAAYSTVHPAVLVLALVVIAPVAEETFFRGVVYNAWEREYGSGRAVAGSTLLFAVIHGSLFVLLPFILLGVLMARLYQRTRSLPAVIALHAGFNAISLGLGLLVRYDIIRVPT